MPWAFTYIKGSPVETGYIFRNAVEAALYCQQNPLPPESCDEKRLCLIYTSSPATHTFLKNTLATIHVDISYEIFSWFGGIKESTDVRFPTSKGANKYAMQRIVEGNYLTAFTVEESNLPSNTSDPED